MHAGTTSRSLSGSAVEMARALDTNDVQQGNPIGSGASRPVRGASRDAPAPRGLRRLESSEEALSVGLLLGGSWGTGANVVEHLFPALMGQALQPQPKVPALIVSLDGSCSAREELLGQGIPPERLWVMQPSAALQHGVRSVWPTFLGDPVAVSTHLRQLLPGGGAVRATTSRARYEGQEAGQSSAGVLAARWMSDLVTHDVPRALLEETGMAPQPPAALRGLGPTRLAFRLSGWLRVLQQPARWRAALQACQHGAVGGGAAGGALVGGADEEERPDNRERLLPFVGYRPDVAEPLLRQVGEMLRGVLAQWVSPRTGLLVENAAEPATPDLVTWADAVSDGALLVIEGQGWPEAVRRVMVGLWLDELRRVPPHVWPDATQGWMRELIGIPADAWPQSATSQEILRHGGASGLSLWVARAAPYPIPDTLGPDAEVVLQTEMPSVLHSTWWGRPLDAVGKPWAQEVSTGYVSSAALAALGPREMVVQRHEGARQRTPVLVAVPVRVPVVSRQMEGAGVSRGTGERQEHEAPVGDVD